MDFPEAFATLAALPSKFVQVTLVATRGSAPQEAGSKLLFGAEGLFWGTVGGGLLEARALEIAREMLGDIIGNAPTKFVEWNLKQDIGMTCGGKVALFFELFQPDPWPIALFGAGHVAQSLAALLAMMECTLRVYDPRPDWLGKLPKAPNIIPIQSDKPESFVESIPAGAYVAIMTQGHSSDLPILGACLRRRELPPYLGVIGSRAKRAQLVRGLRAADIAEERVEKFYCPIGLDIGGSSPRQIAVSVLAQMIAVRNGRNEMAGRSRD